MWGDFSTAVNKTTVLVRHALWPCVPNALHFVILEYERTNTSLRSKKINKNNHPYHFLFQNIVQFLQCCGNFETVLPCTVPVSLLVIFFFVNLGWI